MDELIKMLSEINPSTIAQGGGVLAVILRIFASKKLRQMSISIFIKFVLSFFGKIKYEHHLFTEKKATLFLIENITLATKLKTDIFRIILSIKTETMIDYAEYWSNKYHKEFRKLDRIEMQKRMKRLYRYMTEGKNEKHIGYEEAIKRTLMSKYGDDKGLKYYQYVYIEHFKQYSVIHDATVQNFFSNMFYYQNSDNEALIRYFLNRVLSTIENSIDNLKFTFDGINGELERI